MLNTVLNKAAMKRLAKYLKREFSVPDPEELFAELISEVARMMDICSKHRLLVWGVKFDQTAAKEHNAYISEVISKIPLDLVFALPHVRRSLHHTEYSAFFDEERALRKAEARYDKHRRIIESKTEELAANIL